MCHYANSGSILFDTNSSVNCKAGHGISLFTGHKIISWDNVSIPR